MKEKILNLTEFDLEKSSPFDLLKTIGALLEGNEKYHFLLKSGKHSDRYIISRNIFKYPNLCQFFAKKLISNLKRSLGEEKITEIDYIVSSAFSGVVFGYEVAKKLGVCFEFTKKEKGKQIWDEEIPKGARVLLIDDIFTYGTTATLMIEALKSNPYPFEYLLHKGKIVVGVMIDRSPKNFKANYYVVSAIRLPFQAWDPEKCPLCNKGSKAIRPKKYK